MSVTQPPPQELLAVAYSVAGTSTTTTGHGAPLSTNWGGSFTISSRTTVDVEVFIPYLTVASAAGVFAEAHILIDGVCIVEAFVPHITVGAFTGLGMSAARKVRVAGLAAGSHTIVVQVKVGTAVTGTITGTANNPGLLRVVEV
jgi:hypothetical protein